ncbi:MAG: hypothetical protein CUN52_08070 [Phototrophicales bacterium]|nr:MAG: hypothetical protein CUN52_08070 [Phototrophicales bacterium]
MKTLHIYVIVILITLVACGGGDNTTTATNPATWSNPNPSTPEPAPEITPVAENSAWTPVIETIDGYEMVLVPPGCFMMGSTYGRRDELPEHQICFDKAFWIDRTEITNAQYGSDGAWTGANKPRTNLLWTEARDFCIGRGGRLPSEAEWEYAAAGPSDWVYPWGNTFFADRLLFDKNWFGQPVDVGKYPNGASWVGALDMAGNVWEFTRSIYKPYPYDPTDGREDMNDETSRRVFRSGVYSYIDYGVANSIRFWVRPQDSRDWFIGFRCVKDA